MKNSGQEITRYTSEVIIPTVWCYQKCVHPYCLCKIKAIGFGESKDKYITIIRLPKCFPGLSIRFEVFCSSSIA